jgi:hypothetical protein
MGFFKLAYDEIYSIKKELITQRLSKNVLHGINPLFKRLSASSALILSSFSCGSSTLYQFLVLQQILCFRFRSLKV